MVSNEFFCIAKKQRNEVPVAVVVNYAKKTKLKDFNIELTVMKKRLTYQVSLLGSGLLSSIYCLSLLFMFCHQAKQQHREFLNFVSIFLLSGYCVYMYEET